MLFHETPLSGLRLVEMEPANDERGYFSRFWDGDEFLAHGLNANFVQASFSFNSRRGTLRGMHLQLSPYAEDKLIKVTRGKIFDVAVDLRPDSVTFCHWFGVELSDGNNNMLYIPKGFAHGFLTLADNTEIFYGITARFSPEHYRGVRWDDPAFGIDWPCREDLVMNDRDANFPDFDPAKGLEGFKA